MKTEQNDDGSRSVTLQLEARPGSDGWVRGGPVVDGEHIVFAAVLQKPFDAHESVREAFVRLISAMAIAGVRDALGDQAADSAEVGETRVESNAAEH